MPGFWVEELQHWTADVDFIGYAGQITLHDCNHFAASRAGLQLPRSVILTLFPQTAEDLELRRACAGGGNIV
jgi:hypothetical protein